MTALFSPLSLRGLTIKNRVWMSPMCQYSATDGMPNEWHRVHYGARAVGGVGMAIFEATAVSPEGRITPFDLGLWSGNQIAAFRPIVKFMREQGCVVGVQLAHAGRKASAAAPWQGGAALEAGQGAWTTLAPSAVPYAAGWPAPKEMTQADIDAVVAQFASAAGRAHDAGFQVAEIHMAHGYLLHQFLSPITNKRTDAYGGSLENRMRLPLEVVRAVRAAWSSDLPLLVRVSATDWVEGGWDLPQTVALARALKDCGVDLIDCSTGGLVADAKIPVGPAYQAPFAAAVRAEAQMPVASVGLITEAAQAEGLLNEGKADAVLLGRSLLRDPYWPMRAAKELGGDLAWPPQYSRAKN